MMYAQLAWRYATRRLVNFIAIAALVLALMVQIVAMAVLDGMLVDLEKRLRNMGEQITVTVQSEAPIREEFDAAVANIVQSVPGVEGVTPMIQKVGFIEAGNSAEYVWVQGIDLASELKFSSLGTHLLSYKPDPDNPGWGNTTVDRPGIFMGDQLADRMGVRPGMEVELFYADRNPDGSFAPRSRRFVLTSTFRSGVFERDRYGVYVQLEEAAEFYLSEDYPDAWGRVETFVVWLKDPNQANDLEAQAVRAVTESLSETGAPRLSSDTWQRRWSEVAQGMKHENNLMELVLLLNDAASGFCVFAILVTLVSRRIRDVGLLRCIGASRRGVMVVFLTVGLLIGVTGGALGAAAGAFLSGPLTLEKVDGSWRLAAGGAVATPVKASEKASDRRPRIDIYYEAVTGQPLYPPRMFGTAGEAGLPTVIYPWKLGLYFLAAVLVSVLAALYPAAWAAWREPMSALRDAS